MVIIRIKFVNTRLLKHFQRGYVQNKNPLKHNFISQVEQIIEYNFYNR